MSRYSFALAAALAATATGLMYADPGQGGPRGPSNARIHWARGEAHAARPNRSPNLLYHGGPVMHGTTVQPIFWGTNWGNGAFVGDKISGLQTFFSGMSGSSYA